MFHDVVPKRKFYNPKFHFPCGQFPKSFPSLKYWFHDVLSKIKVTTTTTMTTGVTTIILAELARNSEENSIV